MSSGYGVTPKKNWVSLLKKKIHHKKLPFNVINNSISGSTTYSGLRHLKQSLRKLRPAITIIQLGGNDALQGIDLSFSQANLNQLVSIAKKQSRVVILIGVRMFPNYGAAYVAAFRDMYISVANRQKVKLIPMILKNVAEHPRLMQRDGIHPNDEAQHIILNNIWPDLYQAMKKIDNSSN